MHGITEGFLCIMLSNNGVSRESFARANDTSLSFRNVARELVKAIDGRGMLNTFSKFWNRIHQSGDL